MKRLTILIFSLSFATLIAAQDAKQVFISMPDSILSILTNINREDCIDFLASNMKAKVKNRFDQESEMLHLTDNYISMQLASNSFFEMKLLPINDSTRIICTVQTICSQACDSRIKFYTTQWETLNASNFISLPEKSDFVPDTIPTQIADTLSMSWRDLSSEADLLLVKAALSDSLNTLTFEYTTPFYMDKTSASRFIPLLKRDKIQYDWTNNKFIRRQEEE